MKTIRLTIAMAFILITAYGFFYVGLMGIRKPAETRRIEKGWSVEFNGQTKTDVNLDNYKAVNVRIGDVMVLTNVLPDCGLPCASMYIDNYLAEMDILVDGKEIYSSGRKEYEEGKIIGYGLHIVDMPAGYEGKELKVIYKSGENNGIGSVIAPTLIAKKDAVINIWRKNFFAGAVAIADMLVGICMIGISVAYISANSNFKQMLFIGLFSFFIGLWSFCEHDLVLLINNDYQMKTISEYMALYLAPLFVFAYFWNKIKDTSTDRGRLIYRVIFYGDIILITLSVILHFLGIAHLTQLLLLHHTFIFIMAFYMWVYFIDAIKKRKKNEITFYVGVIILSLFAIVDIIYFNVLTFSSDISGNFNGFSYMGSGIVVISMVMDYSEEMAKNVRRASEIELYEQMANSDFLTGLSNRRQCELVFDEIDQEDSDYAVIAFDLNNLKEVNDKHGHAAGDKLLKDFADILKSVFSSVATVGRTGGDEFLVIIRHAEVLNLDQVIAKLDEKIADVNKRKREYKISAARGICTRADNKKNVRAAYRTADQRMYDNKIRMKAEAKGKLS